MYCKYCGKELKDGARFCDRCGQSVRKTKESSQAARHREIEELKAERLNRKKRLEEKEARQQERKNKKKQKKHGGGVLMFIIIILLIAVLSIIIGYNIFPSGTKTNGNNDETAVSPSPTPISSVSTDKYSEITVGNITIPYPSDFYTNTATGNEKLNLVDSLGGATMVVKQEARNGEITELIKEYIASIGASDSNGGPDMRAGSDYYAVTAEVDGKVYHRKCIVRNGLAVYYDFTYDASSTSAKKYEDYIKTIDSRFK